MASSASILIGIIAGFIVAMALGMVNYGKIAEHLGLHFQCHFNME